MSRICLRCRHWHALSEASNFGPCEHPRIQKIREALKTFGLRDWPFTPSHAHSCENFETNLTEDKSA